MPHLRGCLYPSAPVSMGVPQLGAHPTPPPPPRCSWVRGCPAAGCVGAHPPGPRYTGAPPLPHTHTHAHTCVHIYANAHLARSPLHLLLSCVRLGARPGLSDRRECTQIPSHTGGRTPREHARLASAGAHTFVPADTPPKAHTSHPYAPPPELPLLLHPPGAYKDAHAVSRTSMHTLTPLLIWGCTRAPTPPTHAVHPSTLPAPWGSHVAPPSTEICGTRTPLWQVYTKIHAHDRGLGSRMMPPHACQRRCPHTAAPASDSGSGSVRTDCDHAADGGDGRALGARWHRGHSPGQLPAHPASAE